jgi:hypothetical protein
MDEFGMLNATTSDLWTGRVFLIFFQVFNVIMLLNLVIAILSNTYSTLSSYSLGLYYDTLVQEI